MDNNPKQTAPMDKAYQVYKACRELSIRGIHVYKFNSDGDKAAIQIHPNEVFLNGSELDGCKLVFKE